MKPMKEQKEIKPEETKEAERKTDAEISDEEMDGVSGGVSLQHIGHTLGM